VRDYARIYELPTVVFRQSCIYGPHQFGTEDQGWVAWFTIAAILDRPITIYGDGKQVRDLLFIDDLMAAYESALRHKDETSGQIFNIGGGPENTASLQELLRFLKAEVNSNLFVSYADWRPGDQPVYISNIDKAKRDLDWKPRVEWAHGVRRLVDWVRQERPTIERIFQAPLKLP
jgi:CDP-paratose 2-epimerase